ncbi:MAG: hypothetical protein M3O21_04795, partial [Chloroflexota bacterium]|nr:hypothetical protein [Chloroflexota bacterium]
SPGSLAPPRAGRGRAGVSPPTDAGEAPPPVLPTELALPVNEPVAAPWPETSERDGPGPNWPLVFLFFLAVAVVQTLPLAFHMTDHVMAWPGDSYQRWWDLTWMKQSLLSLSNPFHTNGLYYPQGSDLYLHTLAPVNGALSVPLQLITGNVLLSWNILMLTFLALSGTGGYALAYHVTKDRWAALFGGFLFAFSPFVMMHMNAAHFNIATTWPIPFFALFLLRFFEGRSKRDILLAAVLGALMTWNWVELAIDAGWFALLLFSFWAILKLRRGERAAILPMVRSLLPGIVLWAALSAPIVIPTALAIESGDYTITAKGSQAAYYSPDAFAYFIPSPLWGAGEFANNVEKPYSTRAGSVETTMFLGLSPLILAIVAIASRRKSPLRTSIRFWSLVFGFFAVMSLGPELNAFGHNLIVPLPFKVLQLLPFAGERSEPGRMIIVGVLALGVLASIGVSALARKYAHSFRHAGPLIACMALAVICFEYWNAPVSLASYQVPSIYAQIGQEDGQFSVLDLPLGRATGNSRTGDRVGAAMSDYAQVINGKPSIGGYLSRATDDNLKWLREAPGLGYLACLDCNGYPRDIDLDTQRVRALFSELKIKYVVVNLKTFEGEPSALITHGVTTDAELYLHARLGFQEIASGDGWLAYRDPDVN